MTAREQLIAYLATLFALVVIFISALIAAGRGVGVGEAFGLGTVLGGLIGILRLPSARSPVATTQTGDVNVPASEEAPSKTI